MAAPPQFAPGHDALVGDGTTSPPLAFAVDAVHGDRLTLRVKDAATTGVLRVGTAVQLQYVDRFGVYDVDASVLERTDDTVVVGVPSDGESIRRRTYVRLRAPLDAACLLLDADHNVFTELDASVVDVGGGGAALAIPAIAPTGSTIVCSIALPDGPPVVTVTHVLPNDADPRDHAQRRHVRVQFTLISETDRDRLLQFILRALASGAHG
jgi:hypothetical protein